MMVMFPKGGGRGSRPSRDGGWLAREAKGLSPSVYFKTRLIDILYYIVIDFLNDSNKVSYIIPIIYNLIGCFRSVTRGEGSSAITRKLNVLLSK